MNATSCSQHFLLLMFLSASILCHPPALTPRYRLRRASSEKCSFDTGYSMLNDLCYKMCDSDPNSPPNAKCPRQCVCIPVSTKAEDTCAPLGFNRKTVREDAVAGTPIFSVPVHSNEKWTYRLGRSNEVDGSVREKLNSFIEMNLIGSNYEIIVNKTLDLEGIFQLYGIQLNALKLLLTCKQPDFQDETFEVILLIQPVNEFAPVFLNEPLRADVPENTVPGAVVFILGQYVIDYDMNPTTDELGAFRLHEFSKAVDTSTDGRAYFTLSNPLTGDISLIRNVDFEALKPVNATLFHLNVSASDVHGLTTYTILTIQVQDVDDLPPEFYHPGCPLVVIKTKPCLVSYEASVPVYFTGHIINIVPGHISARDMDTIGTSIEFFLEQGPGETDRILDFFSINRTTGDIRIEQPIAMPMEINLVIVAREVSPLARSTQASLRIIIIRNQDAFVPEGPPGGINIGKMEEETKISGENTRNLTVLIPTILLGVLFMASLLIIIFLCVKLQAIDRLNKIHPSTTESTLDPSLVPSSYHASMYENDTPVKVHSYGHASDHMPSHHNVMQEDSSRHSLSKNRSKSSQMPPGEVGANRAIQTQSGRVMSYSAALKAGEISAIHWSKPKNQGEREPFKSRSLNDFSQSRSTKTLSKVLEDDPRSTVSEPAGRVNKFESTPETRRKQDNNNKLSEKQQQVFVESTGLRKWHENDGKTRGEAILGKNDEQGSMKDEESESHCAESSMSIQGDRGDTSLSTCSTSPEKQDPTTNHYRLENFENVSPDDVPLDSTFNNCAREDEHQEKCLLHQSDVLSILPLERASLLSDENSPMGQFGDTTKKQNESQLKNDDAFTCGKTSKKTKTLNSSRSKKYTISSNSQELSSFPYLQNSEEASLQSLGHIVQNNDYTTTLPPIRGRLGCHMLSIDGSRNDSDSRDSQDSLRSKSSLNDAKKRRHRKKRMRSKTHFDHNIETKDNVSVQNGSFHNQNLVLTASDTTDSCNKPCENGEMTKSKVEQETKQGNQEEENVTASKTLPKRAPIDKSHRQPYMLLKFQANEKSSQEHQQ